MTQGSQTLDLVNDFFRFVTRFFEIISMSAPHIYHSALLLSPKTSSVQELYGPQVTCMMRVIKGMPTSWNPSIANKRCPSSAGVAMWSPCNKFIAITYHGSPEVAILDGTTLEQLCTLYSKNPGTKWSRLLFSPDGHLLTGYLYDEERWIVSWDLQTGGPISYIKPGWSCHSATYSECGTMLGGYFQAHHSYSRIIIYDILSATQIFSHSVYDIVKGGFWTHNGHLQYAIVDPLSITLWEVGFTSGHAPIKVHTLSIPNNIPEEPRELVFFPTLSLLAFTLVGWVFVWDAQGQKILLDSRTDAASGGDIFFSSDGQFFIHETEYSEFCLYKKSPDGYLPHRNLVLDIAYNLFLISPDGGSIISSNGPVLQLWHTKHLPSLPSPVQEIWNACLEFLPDEQSVAIVESRKAVTILDLKSGIPQVIIDPGMEICGIGIMGSEIIVIGSERSIIWELPTGNHTFGTKWNIDHSIQIITFESQLINYFQISILPNLNYMVGGSDKLAILDMYTGEELDTTQSMGILPVPFALDGNKVWYAEGGGGVKLWEIVKSEISGTIKLKCFETIEPLNDFPWQSPCGYKITDDGWVTSSSGQRFLWLPHEWQSDDEVGRKWNGKILALLHDGFPEVVILELAV